MRQLKSAIRRRVRIRAYAALRERGLDHLYSRVPISAIVRQLMLTLPPGGDIEGMHIDHVMPLSAFALEHPAQFAVAFAPKNHRWLSAHDNISKHDKYDPREVMRAIYGVRNAH